MSKKNKKILIFSSNVISLLNFRKQLIKKFIYLNYKVIIVAPKDVNQELINLKKKGIIHYEVNLQNRSLNIFKDLLIFLRLIKIFKKEKPDIVLAYTMKPIILAGFISKIFKFKFFPMFTGLGISLYQINNWINLQQYVVPLFPLHIYVLSRDIHCNWQMTRLMKDLPKIHR